MAEEKDVKEVKVEEIKKAAEERKCPVQRALYYIEGFLDGPMCGKCFPCEMGTYEARIRLREIIEGRGTEDDLVALKRIAEIMRESSRCKKGKDTANYLLEWLQTDVFEKHIAGRCPDMECVSFVEYSIVPEKCTMCGLCKEACKYDAITGEKRRPFVGGYLPFEIRQRKCVKCGECIKVCPEGAVILTEIRIGSYVGA